MSRIARLAIAGIALALSVWMYFAPYLTVRSIRLAAERGDAEALAAHVDFPALRESIKSQFAESLSERIGGGDDGSAFGGLSARLATAITGPAVDTMVSPLALSLLFEGRGLVRDGLTAVAVGSTDGKRVGSGIDLPRWKATMGYRDFSTFAVDLHTDDDAAIPAAFGDAAIPATLIFKRHKLLWWTLSGIDLQMRR
jgi:hypothetical protein